ncbi:sulfite exporter TauE/SafE family protein [Filomicrobium sp.]|uniref:sulfite exporter TauE/SafE family protein n=1 Tax=Filomicrobium sp. TaxID=2024831 RepID=UPI00258F75D9|nr:sulfite exporter TauE/SafE family protein [Filomicrobium sp.]MCV0370534.1 sulfite exporter TauE/SafE family protein [Filomicrobium sp.]
MHASFPDTWILVSLGGLLVGFLIGMTGVGGGSVTTPMLISGFGVAPALAVGTDLLFASITKASAAWRHHKYGNVDWPIFGYLACGSLTSTLITLAWLKFAHPDTTLLASVIRTVLIGALVASSLAVSLVPWWLRRHGSQGTPEMRSAPRPIPTVLYGLLVGALVTLTSVGAGAIGVAILIMLYPNLAARRIVGTDIVHAIPLAFISGVGHLSMGNVDFGLLGALLIGSIPGIMLGSRLVGAFPDWLLRLLLSVVLIYAAYLLYTFAH